MKKVLSIILSLTLFVGCMFISAGAENEMLIQSKFYCGFEDYRAQLTGNTTTDAFDRLWNKTLL